MVDEAALGAFTVTAAVLIAVPGPSVLFVISRGVALGRRAALLTVLGNAAGVLLLVLAVAAGLGAVLERSTVLFDGVRLLGAAYLVYLGVQTFRHRRSLAAALYAPVEPTVLRRILADGFLVGMFNPKVIVFFMAVLPQFVDRSAGAVPVQLLTLGAIFCAIGLLCDSLWALLAGAARSWLVSSPRRLAAIGGTGGLVMIGLGAGLAVSGRAKD